MTHPDLDLPALRAVAEAANFFWGDQTAPSKPAAIVTPKEFHAIFDPPTVLMLLDEVQACRGQTRGLVDTIMSRDAWKARAEKAETALAEARAERDHAVHLLRPFANIAWHIRTNHPGWDHDDFELTVGNDTTALAPFRAALVYVEAIRAQAAKERTEG